MDSNTNGSLYQHLKAARQMLLDLRHKFTKPDDDTLGFFAEQYSYLCIVSNIHFRLNHKLDAQDVVGSPGQALGDLNIGTAIYGCLFGCAHKLFETIPLICDLARSRMRETRKPSRLAVDCYLSLLSTLQDWQPDSAFQDKAFEYSGRLYQSSSIIFLKISLYGPYSPTFELLSDIDEHLDSFLRYFSLLPYESASWTTVMWPVLVAGSCMREHKQRDLVSGLILGSTFQMRVVQNMLRVLLLFWSEMDRDGNLYGPYGFERFLTQSDIVICVG